MLSQALSCSDFDSSLSIWHSIWVWRSHHRFLCYRINWSEATSSILCPIWQTIAQRTCLMSPLCELSLQWLFDRESILRIYPVDSCHVSHSAYWLCTDYHRLSFKRASDCYGSRYWSKTLHCHRVSWLHISDPCAFERSFRQPFGSQLLCLIVA